MAAGAASRPPPFAMASSWRTRGRIAYHVLCAPGFFDALAGRFLWQPEAPAPDVAPVGRWRDLRGALHVHTSTYSDGAGDVPTVMAAAREAGVDFLLLTDHNTLQPQRDGWPVRFSAPLLLVGTEITVAGGAFLLGLDLPDAFDFPPRRPAQAAIDAVRAAGGLALVSLPFDMKHPWVDWEARGCQGIETLNLSTIARGHINLLSLLWLLPLWRRRGDLAVLRAIAARPDEALAKWDTLLAQGDPWIGIGALDAHALMKIGRKKYPIPSYADSFRAVSTHVLIPPEASDLPRAIGDALRAGRCYFSYDCLGDPSGLAFEGEGGAPMGGAVGAGAELVARSAPGTLLRLFCRGRVVASGRGALRFRAVHPGAYRIEAYRAGRPLGPLQVGARPWAFTNPIYVK